MSQPALPMYCDMTDLPVETCGCPVHARPAPPIAPGASSTVVDVLVHRPFWQLWLKTVTGVNLDEHCMKSLRGPNADGLGQGVVSERWLRVVTAPVRRSELIGWYLCGVSYGNILERNAHLFAVPEPGCEARLEWEWGQAVIHDARAIKIVPDWIDPRHPKARVPVYRTCRNWQAAWMIAGNKMMPADTWSRLEDPVRR